MSIDDRATSGKPGPGLAKRSWADALADQASRNPGRLLAAVLAFHFVVWTLLPILVCSNLQLDLAEDLALGKEWQLGYWKHPPLPWWTADLAYRLLGDVRAVYLLGPLAAIACLYFVWRLARELLEPAAALIAVLALEGLHYFNFSVVKFAHDQMQLPFWALTGWLAYRAIAADRARDWIGAGAALALAFWSKYAALALGFPILLFLVFDPMARPRWRGPGPYLMAAAFLALLAPNIWWLVHSGFQPLRYVDQRAIVASRWYDYLWFPVRWTGSQILALLPVVGLLALIVARPGRAGLARLRSASFEQRYALMLGLGPFLFTTLVAIPLGRLPLAMWGYPLWCFTPLALLAWLKPAPDRRRLALFARWVVVVLLAWPIAYGATELGEPFLRDRPKATQFPGREMAALITERWHAEIGTALVYVTGTEFEANNMAVYSPDRPHVLVHADPALSPWIDMADLKRRGAVLVWSPASGGISPQDLLARFPAAEMQDPLVLPRHTLYPRKPVTVFYAFLKPQP
ncbi:MAG TPA: glycosyltransferase family 39 protein [Candidatus Udaeobacter sp.]|nr:glycosyltransferase family 39 protein [Candidatus Udaeobacter sp.]